MTPLISHRLFALLAGPIAIFLCGFAAAATPVAVFVDRDWATMSRNDVLPAPLVADLLEPHVSVTRLSAADLANPAKLGAAQISVLVLPETDALPADAIQVLREYRRAGGCLVMSNNPFAKLAARDPNPAPGKPAWTMQPAGDLRGHDDAGLALFRMAGTVRHDRPCTRTVPENPLGITQPMLESRLANQQRLDPKSPRFTRNSMRSRSPHRRRQTCRLPAVPVPGAIRSCRPRRRLPNGSPPSISRNCLSRSGQPSAACRD